MGESGSLSLPLQWFATAEFNFDPATGQPPGGRWAAKGRDLHEIPPLRKKVDDLEATTTTTTTTGTPTATTTAAATASEVFARTGFIDGQVAAIEGGAIKGTGCGFAFGGGAHGDETESAGATCGAVLHDLDVCDRAILLECVLKIGFGCIEGDVADV